MPAAQAALPAWKRNRAAYRRQLVQVLLSFNGSLLWRFLQAGWVAAFDTGDHWQFITELGRELEDQ